jgi:hypothetical protein
MTVVVLEPILAELSDVEKVEQLAETKVVLKAVLTAAWMAA